MARRETRKSRSSFSLTVPNELKKSNERETERNSM